MHRFARRTEAAARGSVLAALLLLALPLGFAACAPGAPPPGPIDLVRKVFDPSYDYTESPDTWSHSTTTTTATRVATAGTPAVPRAT